LSLNLDFSNPFPELSEVTPEPPEEGRFVVQTLDQAEWCLRQIERLKKKQSEIEALAQAEIEKISVWRERETSKITGDISFFEELLKDFHRRTLEKDPKAKTIRLPSGSLEARKMPPEYRRDEEKLLPWVEQNRPDFLIVEKSVNWADLKKKLSFENGCAFDPITGEVVPGIEVIERGLKYRVRVGGTDVRKKG